MSIFSSLFDKKNSRKLTNSEKAMCASVVTVCALAAVLILAVKLLLA